MSVPFILAAFLVVAATLASASFSDSSMVVTENTASQTYSEITFVITSRDSQPWRLYGLDTFGIGVLTPFPMNFTAGGVMGHMGANPGKKPTDKWEIRFGFSNPAGQLWLFQVGYLNGRSPKPINFNMSTPTGTFSTVALTDYLVAPNDKGVLFSYDYKLVA